MTYLFILISVVFANPVDDTVQAEETTAPAAVEAPVAPPKDVRVVLDITRGVQKAKIFENGALLKEYPISGSKNKAIVVKGQRFCAFTTTGSNIKPTELHTSRYSREHDLNLLNFVTFDGPRGIGAHSGDTSGFSSGCVRQTSAGAKALYDVVKANSVIPKGSARIQSTNVRMDVIDNTPGRYTAECNCLRSHMRDTSSARARRVCGLAVNEPKASPSQSVAKKDPAPGEKPVAGKKTTPAPKKTLEQRILSGKAVGLF